MPNSIHKLRKCICLSVLTLLCLTAHAVADRGGLWDEGFDKMAAKCQSSSSPYTISFSQFSDEEDTVDCEIIEKLTPNKKVMTRRAAPKRENKKTRRGLARKIKQLRRDGNLADIFLAFVKGKQEESKSAYFKN